MKWWKSSSGLPGLLNVLSGRVRVTTRRGLRSFSTIPSSPSSSGSSSSSFYITTPIFYVNGDPHLGHAYSLIVADTLARYHRNIGEQVYSLTGTDEYGQKVEQSARALSKSPLEFATEKSNSFRELVRVLNCSPDDFIRTTETRHTEVVTKLWKLLQERGALYEGVYSGWYSVRDETFYSEDELVDGKAPTGADVIWLEENVYFFRLSAWRNQLREYYETHDSSIVPSHKKADILRILTSEDDLKDVCVSRRNISWGIPVPSVDPSQPTGQIIYVWLDALTNYISALGYSPDLSSSNQSKLMRTFWPVNVHVVGKDILRFHALLWPAILLALDLPLPQTIIAHGWWTKDGVKMSKSVGNVVDPFQLIETYGSDSLRFFLLSEVSLGGDGDFNLNNFITRINSHLSDNLGNLAQRVLSMIHKNCEGSAVPPPILPLLPQDEAVLNESLIVMENVSELMKSHNLNALVEEILRVPRLCNKYVVEEAPWKLRKTDPERMNTVLYVLVESLRRTAILFEPILPCSSIKILDQLQVPPEMRSFQSITSTIQPGLVIKSPVPIFPKYTLPTTDS